MKIKQKMALHNRFDITVVDKNTGKVKQRAVAYNVITDGFFKLRLDLMGNVSMNANIGYIGVGTGSGIPATTDTSLYNRLVYRTSTVIEEHYEYPTSYITRQIKLNADEFNGKDITEVGLVCHYVYGIFSTEADLLCTHAMLQDAEGNQIAIHKTDVDVVYINATFYCTYTPSGFGDNGIYPPADKNDLVKWALKGSLSVSCRAYCYDLESSSDLSNYYVGSKSLTPTDGVGVLAELTFDFPVLTLLDTEFNNHRIKCIGFPGIGAFRFPDPSVMPDYVVDHMVIGEGDGETTEFNIKCPCIKKDTVRVFVGGNELQKEQYVVDYDNNCVDCYEFFPTSEWNLQTADVKFGDLEEREPDTASRYRDPLSWKPYPETEYLYPASCVVKEDKPIWVNFGKPELCNEVRIDNRMISATYLPKLVIEYSSDNAEWTKVEYTLNDHQYSSGSTGTHFYTFRFPKTEAQYWRVYIPGYSWTYYLYTSSIGTRDGASISSASFFIGRSVPGLTLMQAPQLGETVEVSYNLDVPFKTENNIIRLTCTIQLQRG